MRILKYIGSGCIGITVNLGLYRFLVEVWHMGYLPGSIIAVSCSTIVSFVLQKYWTFEERSRSRTHIQFALHVVLALCNIGLNTLIVYLLVTYGSVYYLLAQAIAAALVAISSFFVYREIIFKRSRPQELPL